MAVLESVSGQTLARVETAIARVTEDQLVYVKAVRAAAMCVIVTLHVAFPLIYLYNSTSYDNWWIATMFYSWGKVGSPLFTMVSGLLLLNPGKEQPIPVFFKKRFIKVLLPFVAWVFLYLLWRVYFFGDTINGHDIVVAIFKGPMYYHLWFIQMILGLYLATPILRVYIRHASRTNLSYFLGVWFVANSVLPVVERFTGVEVGIDIVVTSNYVGYFVLGYYLRDVKIGRKHILPLLMAMVAALVFTQVATLKMTQGLDGTLDNFFLLHESFNLVIVAVCAFLLLKSLDYDVVFARLPFIRKAVMWISSCSLGIYFIHVMFIDLLASGKLGFTLTSTSFTPLLTIPLIAILAMVASIISVTLMKKVPILRQIVP